MTSLLLAAANPMLHVVQHDIWAPGGLTIVTNQLIMMLIAAGLLLFFLPRLIQHRAGDDGIDRLVPTGWGNAIEGICEALRVHVARPALGQHTDQFIPYIWTAFFFVLTCNVLGMIPLADWTFWLGGGHVLGGTATGNIWVTACLAVCTLFMIVYNGLRLHGMAYVSHFFMGPPGINVVIAGLELIGLIAKTFALCVRLFANMVAGHVMLAVIVGFVGGASSIALALGVTVPVIAGAVAVNLLELFVAFLQAFIFTFLSAMFIGQAVNIHHDHEHEHEHEHEASSAH
jgi:F-type H+-transporting ATPase subunit a